jgi:hypothetical protein
MVLKHALFSPEFEDFPNTSSLTVRKSWSTTRVTDQATWLPEFKFSVFRPAQAQGQDRGGDVSPRIGGGLSGGGELLSLLEKYLTYYNANGCRTVHGRKPSPRVNPLMATTKLNCNAAILKALKKINALSALLATLKMRASAKII